MVIAFNSVFTRKISQMQHARGNIELPSIRSIADRYRADPVSAAFASNMDGFILEHQPRLWIHGHTHESFDYEIGKTRVVCNPRGYASIEENKGFRPDYTLVA